jgi:hypothetical protein
VNLNECTASAAHSILLIVSQIVKVSAIRVTMLLDTYHALHILVRHFEITVQVVFAVSCDIFAVSGDSSNSFGELRCSRCR